MKKRIFAFLLASILLLSLLPVTALAEDSTGLGLLMYNAMPFNDDSLTDTITVDGAGSVFYIALSPESQAQGCKMTEVHTTFGPEITHPSVTTIGTVVLSDDGSYATVTVSDAQANGSYHFEAVVENTNPNGGPCGVWGRTVPVRNNLPTLRYRYLNWDDDSQSWYAPEESALQTSLTLESGNSFPVQFYYGTMESYTEVDFSDLAFPTDIMYAYMRDGALWVEAAAYAGSGAITYPKGDVTASMNVRIIQPDFGFYSSSVAGAETFLGRTIDVNSTNTVFYIVARQGCTIPGIEAIQNNQTGEDVTDQFTVSIAGDGSYAEVRMDADHLPAAGNHTILISQDWGTRYLNFDLIRGDLPELSTPTELAWNKQYAWGWAQHNPYSLNDENGELVCTERMGAMSFKAGDLAQNRFSVEVYSAADNYTSPVASGDWQFGDMDQAEYFSVTDFIYAQLPSGTYKFRVRANGDGTVYRDSPWSDLSPAWTYVEPSAQLPAPDASQFFWSEEDGHYFSNWQHSGQAATGYYEIKWYYQEGSNFLFAQAGCFDMGVWDTEPGSIYNTMLYDEVLEKYGNGKICFRVRAIPADITAYRISPWSDYSQVLDVDTMTGAVNQKLEDLLNGDTSAATVEDVQTALAEDTAKLHTAMAADLELSGGASGGTLDLIRQLEANVSDNVQQRVEASASAPAAIQGIANGVSMIGATLNLAGETSTVTLALDAPKEGIVIDEQQHNAVQFSMKLDGAVDKDDVETAGQQLIVPVVIDMPVPNGVNPDFLVILHKLWDGSIEQIRPYIYRNETTNRWHARFVVDSFSDFAFVEYTFCFAQGTVSKQVGDAPFTIAATGNAEGSAIGYSSSNPDIATVNPETGEVTIHSYGTVIITATASATAVYPEAQCSYTLKVFAFHDVPADAYYKNAMTWAVENAITYGTSATTFSPDAPCTRAQAVSFLWRAAGKPEPTSASGFSDVAVDAYYAKAVAWAVENKITAGTSATTFSPDATCTRAQIVSFLWRFADKPAADGAGNPFQDVLDGEYYYGAVLWAVENKITAGTSATTFSPEAPCTRAQIVSFLYRCLGQ